MATEEFLRQLITEPDRLNDLVNEAKLLAFQHGFIMRTQETPNSSEVRATTQICLIHMFYNCKFS